MAELLIKSGANVNAINSFHDTPLHIAARSLCAPMVNALLTAQADFSLFNSEQRTPLHEALAEADEQIHCPCNTSNRAEIVELLVASGCDVNAPDRKGNTALHLAAITSDVTVVQVLLDHGAIITSINNIGETPLSCAFKHGNKAVSKQLQDESCHVQ